MKHHENFKYSIPHNNCMFGRVSLMVRRIFPPETQGHVTSLGASESPRHPNFRPQTKPQPKHQYSHPSSSQLHITSLSNKGKSKVASERTTAS